MTVLSQMTGMPHSWAIRVIYSKFGTSFLGLPIDSMNTARVLSLIALAKLFGSDGSTRVTSMRRR